MPVTRNPAMVGANTSIDPRFSEFPMLIDP